ncbi:MAG: SMC family ATPase [Candidatus Wallbacteria bacterium]|nr:SMC family ATPase [Candidatus Wallbacteria bacterium]
MILKTVQAENFQRYDRLEIANLPERGIVGVVGENESGKSTIGEIISFAFFGRTLKLDEDHVRESIQWGKDSSQVRVAFQLPDGATYQVTRDLDRDGSYSAELVDIRTGSSIARGVGKVNRKLAELLGIPFEEFRYSFYLGQKELSLLHDSTPESRRNMLDKMIGVNNVEEASAKVAVELAALQSKKRTLDDEAMVHREVIKQIAVDPKGRDRVQNALREQEADRASRDAEVSRLGHELDEVGKNLGSIGVARALGLRAILRGYGVAFGRLAGWLRQGGGQLNGRLQTLDREAATTAAKLEEYRVFEAKREELASVVKLRRQEIDAQLKNAIEADWKPEDAPFISPNSKAEQLAVTQKQLVEAAAEEQRLKSWGFNRGGIGCVLWASGLGFLFGLHQYDFIFFVMFGLLYLIWGLVTWMKGRDTGDRRSRLSMNADRLAEDVGKAENARQACSRFDTASGKAMADNVDLIGSELVRELYKALKTRFSEFLERSEGYSEEMVGKVNTARDEASGLRRELAEVELLTADLEEEIERLSRGGHARVARPAAAPAETYKSGEARGWRGRIRGMIERCRKAQFELEAAPVDALDRDFAEFRPALERMPAGVGGDLNVAVLAELDSTVSGLDASALERTLETEGGKLANLVAASDDLRSKQESLSHRQQESKLTAGRAALRQEELARELGRIEPDVARGIELENRLAEIAGKVAALERELAVHRTLLEMFGQLRDQMRGRFGPQIAEYIGWVLPQLTDNRYHDVKVTPELDVEVFSPDKNGYVSISSLSGGTVDQLFLTLRLAFSKALLYTKLSPEYKQYLFFDEPIASFDTKRSESFLELLRKFHCNFDQVFVVTHTPGSENHFDRTIRTSMAARELVSN